MTARVPALDAWSASPVGRGRARGGGALVPGAVCPLGPGSGRAASAGDGRGLVVGVVAVGVGGQGVRVARWIRGGGSGGEVGGSVCWSGRGERV